MTPEEFGEKLTHEIHKGLLKVLSDGNWILPDWKNRVQIPESFMIEVWKFVDVDKVKLEIKDRIEKEIADRIVNKIASELAGDIKTLLNNQVVRTQIARMASDYVVQLTSEGIKNGEMP